VRARVCACVCACVHIVDMTMTVTPGYHTTWLDHKHVNTVYSNYKLVNTTNTGKSVQDGRSLVRGWLHTHQNRIRNRYSHFNFKRRSDLCSLPYTCNGLFIWYTA